MRYWGVSFPGTPSRLTPDRKERWENTELTESELGQDGVPVLAYSFTSILIFSLLQAHRQIGGTGE